MADLKQEFLDKGLDGKIPTDENLPARDERLDSSVRPEHVLESVESVFGLPGDLRFVGDLSDEALYTQNSTAPNSEPFRHRRLEQRLLFHGADVRAEGTKGTISAGDTLDLDGVDVSHLNGVSGLILVLSNTSDGGSGSNYGTYDVDSTTTGTSVTITSSDFDTPDSDTYIWQVVDPNPSRLMPYPSGGAPGDEEVWLTIKPSNWPIVSYDDEGNFNGPVATSHSLATNYTGETDSTGSRIEVVIDNTGGSTLLSSGQFVEFGNTVFLVQNSSLNDPNDEETLTLDPLYNQEIFPLPSSVSDTVDELYTVGDVVDDPTSSIQAGTYDSIINSPWLDDIRVAEVVDTEDGPSETQGRSADDMIRGGSSENDVGFGIVFYPADGSGNPDLTSPIRNLDNVTIDPSVDQADQEVLFDSQDGVLRLSHPISATGGDLNPAGWTDSNGRPRLFATFFSYRGPTAPNEAQSLKSDAPRRESAGSNEPKGGREASLSYNRTQSSQTFGHDPIQSRSAWRMKDATQNLDEMYHQSPSGRNFGGRRPSIGFFFGQSGLPNYGSGVLHQRRNPSHGFRQVGMIGYDPLGSDEFRNEFVIAPNMVEWDGAREIVGLDRQPHFSFKDGLKKVDNGSGSSTYTISAGENFEGIINDQYFDVDPADGSGLSTSSVVSDLDSKISAATSLSSSEWDIYSPDGQQIVIEASDFLWIGEGTANSSLGFGSDLVLNSERLELGFGWDRLPVNRIRWDQSVSDLAFDGTDFRLDGGAGSDYLGSLRDIAESDEDVRSRWVASGFGTTSSVGDANFVVQSGRLKHQRSQETEGRVFKEYTSSTTVSLPSSSTVYVYYDATTDSIETSDVSNFTSIVSDGVPLWRVRSDGSSQVDAFWDVRDWGHDLEDKEIFTVGSSKGRFHTLFGVLAYLQDLDDYASGGTHERRVVLVSDITYDPVLNTSSSDDPVIPGGTTIDGQGYTVTVQSTTDSYVMQTNGSDDVTVKNVKFSPTVGLGSFEDAFKITGDTRHFRMQNVRIEPLHASVSSGNTGPFTIDSSSNTVNFFVNGFEVTETIFPDISASHSYTAQQVADEINRVMSEAGYVVGAFDDRIREFQATVSGGNIVFNGWHAISFPGSANGFMTAIGLSGGESDTGDEFGSGIIKDAATLTDAVFENCLFSYRFELGLSGASDVRFRDCDISVLNMDVDGADNVSIEGGRFNGRLDVRNYSNVSVSDCVVDEMRTLYIGQSPSPRSSFQATDHSKLSVRSSEVWGDSDSDPIITVENELLYAEIRSGTREDFDLSGDPAYQVFVAGQTISGNLTSSNFTTPTAVSATDAAAEIASQIETDSSPTLTSGDLATASNDFNVVGNPDGSVSLLGRSTISFADTGSGGVEDVLDVSTANVNTPYNDDLAVEFLQTDLKQRGLSSLFDSVEDTAGAVENVDLSFIQCKGGAPARSRLGEAVSGDDTLNGAPGSNLRFSDCEMATGFVVEGAAGNTAKVDISNSDFQDVGVGFLSTGYGTFDASILLQSCDVDVSGMVHGYSVNHDFHSIGSKAQAMFALVDTDAKIYGLNMTVDEAQSVSPPVYGVYVEPTTQFRTVSITDTEITIAADQHNGIGVNDTSTDGTFRSVQLNGLSIINFGTNGGEIGIQAGFSADDYVHGLVLNGFHFEGFETDPSSLGNNYPTGTASNEADLSVELRRAAFCSISSGVSRTDSTALNFKNNQRGENIGVTSGPFDVSGDPAYEVVINGTTVSGNITSANFTDATNASAAEVRDEWGSQIESDSSFTEGTLPTGDFDITVGGGSNIIIAASESIQVNDTGASGLEDILGLPVGETEYAQFTNRIDVDQNIGGNDIPGSIIFEPS